MINSKTNRESEPKMTVIRPNSLSGIPLHVREYLAIHDSDHNLIRELASGSGISTFLRYQLPGYNAVRTN